MTTSVILSKAEKIQIFFELILRNLLDQFLLRQYSIKRYVNVLEIVAALDFVHEGIKSRNSIGLKVKKYIKVSVKRRN